MAGHLQGFSCCLSWLWPIHPFLSDCRQRLSEGVSELHSDLGSTSSPTCTPTRQLMLTWTRYHHLPLELSFMLIWSQHHHLPLASLPLNSFSTVRTTMAQCFFTVGSGLWKTSAEEKNFLSLFGTSKTSFCAYDQFFYDDNYGNFDDNYDKSD